MNSIRNWLAGTMLAAGAVLTVGAGVSLAATDDAMPPGPAAHGWHHHDGMHMYEKLGLSDAQKAQIKGIMDAAKPQMQALHQQMQDNALKLHQTQPNDPNYDAVVAEVSQSNATLQAQATTQMAGVHKQIFIKVLTPAQQTQLQQLQADGAAHMHEHHMPN